MALSAGLSTIEDKTVIERCELIISPLFLSFAKLCYCSYTHSRPLSLSVTPHQSPAAGVGGTAISTFATARSPIISLLLFAFMN